MLYSPRVMDTQMDTSLLTRRFNADESSRFGPFDLDYEPLDVGNAKSFIQKWTWGTAPVTYRVIYEMVCGIGLPNK